MLTKEEMELAAKFYTKVSKLRAEVLTKDWADDKRLSIGGVGGYGYLSNDKIVKQVAPLFPKYGLEVEKRFFDLQKRDACGHMSEHWTCQVEVTLIDIDTGFRGNPSVAYGEAGDVGDKGINKAQTCADKNWHIKFFNLADGIDPDSESVEAYNAKKFMKTAEEKEVATSKILEAAKKSAVAPAPAPKVVPPVKAEAPKPEPKKEEPKSEPKKEEPKSDEPAGKFVPKLPQKKAIDGILATWEGLAKDGKVTPAEYNEMSGAYVDINSDSSAVAFIRKYRRSA